jgi:hypothetical protein
MHFISTQLGKIDIETEIKKGPQRGPFLHSVLHTTEEIGTLALKVTPFQ